MASLLIVDECWFPRGVEHKKSVILLKEKNKAYKSV